MIYLFLKRIVRWAFFIFFRKKRVYGQDNIPQTGPLIIAINHPNTLIDPLLVASQISRRVGFLANASIFINGIVKGIFSYFSVIPVYRKKDLPPGEKRDNAASFRKCYEFFDRNGAILIFPEGTSVNELKLREIKTGTARIALGYEAERGFTGTLQINTVALNYSDSLRFRSMVSMNINPAFKVSDFQTLWEEDEEQAVRELTERIKEEIEGKITVTESKKHEAVVLQTQNFYSEYIDTSFAKYSNPEGAFELRKRVANQLKMIEHDDVKTYRLIASKLNNFFSSLMSLHITPGFLKDSFLNRNSYVLVLTYVIQLIVLFPFYILGLLSNYIPYRIPDWIYQILKVDEEYKSSISVVFGMIVFPLYYAFLIHFFRLYISDYLGWSLLLVIVFPLLGFCTLFYYRILLRFSRVIRFYLFVSRPKKIGLLKQRNDLILIINQHLNLI
jgi:1-acyl-sn-glycerol-3-phosphate acyltransferase